MMIDLMFDIPSIEGPKRVMITKEVVNSEEKPEIIPVKKTA